MFQGYAAAKQETAETQIDSSTLLQFNTRMDQLMQLVMFVVGRLRFYEYITESIIHHSVTY